MKNSPTSSLIELIATDEMVNERLDKALSFAPEVQSRSKAELLIKSHRVRVNGKIEKASYRVAENDRIQLEIPEPKPQTIEKLDLDLDIKFEDDHLIVINKPPGLVVHPSAGHESDTLVNALINHSQDFLLKFSDHRPGIVHRIDKDTSGLLVVAKDDSTLDSLAKQFKARTVHRLYQAIVIGKPHESKGRVTSYLSRHPFHRKKFSSVLGDDKKIIRDPNSIVKAGKWAATNYRLLKSHDSGICLLELKLETGRTHQIRVHLSELGSPILNDEIYGSPSRQAKIKSKEIKKFITESPRCALHAMELGFKHPRTGHDLFFKEAWPDYSRLLQLLESL